MLAAVFCRNAKTNKMELEVKHLAPYLPYELNVQVMYNTGFKVEKLKELKIKTANYSVKLLKKFYQITILKKILS